MPDSDPLAEKLAAISDIVTSPRERIGDLKAKAAWTPRLLAAVEAVLSRHHPEDRGRVLPCCAFCCTDAECVAWAECPEREDIASALLGEDGSDVRALH